MLVRGLHATAALWLLASCSAGSLHWPEAEPQDPAPSGPGYLRTYKESHFRALGDGFRGTTTLDGFCARVARVRVLFLGDHHGDPALHERFLALLMELDRRGTRYELGLECIGVQDEVAVDAYLRGSLDLAGVVRTTRARQTESWLESDDVDSAFYRALLTRARTRGVPVFGLEPTPRPPLYERDQGIARRVRARARAKPNTLLVVVVGETHLLGQGQLLRRVDLPHVAVAARLSVALRERAQELHFDPDAAFVESMSGLHFFLPLADVDD
ncbi:MAG: ChaN family lipoprotein [Planctomycetota bacterium]